MPMQVRRQSFGVVRLEARLPGIPPAVWPFLTEPALLNRWSTAPVQGLETGDGGGFGTVGALRHVRLPSPLPTLTEAIQHADPPVRFVYRAVGSRAVRYHRGVLRLSPDGGGTRLRWEIGMALAVPGATALVRRMLEPRLEESIQRLSSVVGDAPHVTVPHQSFADDPDPAAADTARDTAEALRVLAEEMEARGDTRHWFSRVYQYVTEAMVEACARGNVAHRTWALRLVPRFHQLYRRSVDGSPEPHWREAFQAIDAAGSSGPLAFWGALVAGARAHIEGDLPRALAATYTDHYRHRCDYERFRADFLLLAAPLQDAWQRLASQVPSRWFPPHLRLLDHLLPAEAVEHLTAKRFYDPLTARRHAFEQGRVLAAASGGAPESPPQAAAGSAGPVQASPS